jgi:superfamily I DNA and/or RNA helicase
LYTAITRAKDKLYLIGFKEESFEEWWNLFIINMQSS